MDERNDFPAEYEIQMSAAVGPRVLYEAGAAIEDIEAALPEGWTVDWSSQVRIAPAGTDAGWTFSAPLVQVEQVVCSCCKEQTPARTSQWDRRSGGWFCKGCHELGADEPPDGDE